MVKRPALFWATGASQVARKDAWPQFGAFTLPRCTPAFTSSLPEWREPNRTVQPVQPIQLHPNQHQRYKMVQVQVDWLHRLISGAFCGFRQIQSFVIPAISCPKLFPCPLWSNKDLSETRIPRVQISQARIPLVFPSRESSSSPFFNGLFTGGISVSSLPCPPSEPSMAAEKIFPLRTEPPAGWTGGSADNIAAQ